MITPKRRAINPCFDNLVLCFDNFVLCFTNIDLCFKNIVLCFKNCLLCLQIWATVIRVDSCCVVAQSESISGETIQLCKRGFATNSANQPELQHFHTPGSYIQQIDFQWNDSTLQGPIHDELIELTRIAINSNPLLLPTPIRLRLCRRTFTMNQVESWSTSDESTEVHGHMLKTSKVHVSWFHRSWLPVVQVDCMRIEWSCRVPQTNQLKFAVTY